MNYAAAVHADKWIPVLPNTDAALYLAIAYQWIKEGTYDKEYIATHAYGFDKFEDYIMGRDDGEPKTPEWASPICGVPSRIIKALAKDWASKRTTVCIGNGGPGIRGPYAHERGRLQAHAARHAGLRQTGLQPGNDDRVGRLRPHGADVDAAATAVSSTSCPPIWVVCPPRPTIASFIPKCLVPKAILEKNIDWYGNEAEL